MPTHRQLNHMCAIPYGLGPWYDMDWSQCIKWSQHMNWSLSILNIYVATFALTDKRVQQHTLKRQWISMRLVLCYFVRFAHFATWPSKKHCAFITINCKQCANWFIFATRAFQWSEKSSMKMKSNFIYASSVSNLIKLIGFLCSPYTNTWRCDYPTPATQNVQRMAIEFHWIGIDLFSKDGRRFRAVYGCTFSCTVSPKKGGCCTWCKYVAL